MPADFKLSKNTEAMPVKKAGGLFTGRLIDQASVWDRRIEFAFLAFLAGSFAWLVYFAGHKLFWFDEFLSFYTEHVPTAAGVLRIQATNPVSLDPPFYHLLGYWAMALFATHASSLQLLARLPSLLGNLLMTAAVYTFTRRLAGMYVAAISVAGLILTYDFYLVEARPYGILLGASALSLVCWQSSIRYPKRLPALIGLFVSLSLAVSCHYFGILVAVPLMMAEAVRAYRLRKLDLPILAAILPSYAFVLSWLPYLHAASGYKAHYYIKPDFMTCIRSFSWLSEINRDIPGISNALNWLMFLLLLATVLAGALLGYRGRHKAQTALRNHSVGSSVTLPSAAPEEWLALIFLAILPIFGGILSVAGAGSFLPRYVLESGIGLMIPRVSGVLYFFPSRLLKTLTLAVMSSLIIAGFVRDQTRNQRDLATLDACLSLTASDPVVIPDQYDDYMRLQYLHPGESTRYRWVADMEKELAWEGTDNVSRTMLNIQQFTSLPVVSYQDLLRGSRKFVLVQTKANKKDWLVRQLRQDRAEFTLRTTAGDHLIYDVQLPAALP